jgi:hypothetical protein
MGLSADMDKQTADLTQQAEDALRQLRHCIEALSTARQRSQALIQELTYRVQRGAPDSKMGQAGPCATRAQRS